MAINEGPDSEDKDWEGAENTRSGTQSNYRGINDRNDSPDGESFSVRSRQDAAGYSRPQAKKRVSNDIGEVLREARRKRHKFSRMHADESA